MEFLFSKTELQRRKKAFTTMIVSLLGTFTIAGLFFWLKDYQVWGLVLISLVVVFIIFEIFIINFFKAIFKTKVSISDEYLERITPRSHEKVVLGDIKNITTVETTQGEIREIRIYFGKENLVLEGLDHLKDFKNALFDKCDKAKKTRKKEPINYDHPFFYLIFGIVMGLAALFFLKAIANVNFNGLSIYYLISLYALALSLFFFFGQPIKKRYNEGKTADYTWGFLILVGGIIPLLFIYF